MIEKNLKLEYAALNMAIIPLIPLTSQNILDVGCGTGELGLYIKDKFNSVVDGITYSEKEAALCRDKIDEVFVVDLNVFESSLLNLKKYDCIICSHILEHLYEPWKLIKCLEQFLKPDGVFIIAVPNIMFYKHIKEVWNTGFKYSLHGGILDITHFRFFTWYNLDLLLSETKLELTTKIGTGNFPLSFLRKIFPLFAAKIDFFFVKKFPNYFSDQFLLTLIKQ